MGTYVSNSYVRVPAELNAEELLLDVHAYLQQACNCDSQLAKALRQSRVRYKRGEEWICLYEVGFKSKDESNIIEVLRTITQKFADEVVMLSCFGVVSFGAYARFVEGVLVRYTAECEDWKESIGSPDAWEVTLTSQMGGIYEGTIVEMGKLLGLQNVADHSLQWDIDIPLK